MFYRRGAALTPETHVHALYVWMVRTTAALTSALRLGLRLPLKALLQPNPLPTTLPRLEGNLVLVRLLAAGRILLFPKKLLQFWMLGGLRPYFAHTKDPDTLFFITHNYYLSKYFTVAQRVDAAIAHYRHERIACGPAYHEAVYHSPDGLVLWRCEVGGTKYTLTLRATEDFRTEGDLSILCCVDDVRVCRISFSYIQGTSFGLGPGMTLFVTRNQTDRRPELQMFRDHFKQNSPPYFCMAALCGIAMAHGIRDVCLVGDQAQIAYDSRYATSFKNSYSAFWQGFGAEPVQDGNAYTMSVPPKLNSIANVKHKSRAIARRQHWLEIMADVRQVILRDRLTHQPQPIEVESAAFLPEKRAYTE